MASLPQSHISLLMPPSSMDTKTNETKMKLAQLSNTGMSGQASTRQQVPTKLKTSIEQHAPKEIEQANWKTDNESMKTKTLIP